MATPLAEVPAETLDAGVDGSGLSEPMTLRGQLTRRRPTLVAFVRHFGCIFCRELVKDLRIASETADGQSGERRYPKVVFVHLADAERGADFFGRYWPAIPAIADPDKRLFSAFGLGHGSVGQMFAPGVWACGVRAAMKGHRIGRPFGDPWTMPGLFLLAEGSPEGEGPVAVMWQHTFRHAGDHPDLHAIVDHARQAKPAQAAVP